MLRLDNRDKGKGKREKGQKTKDKRQKTKDKRLVHTSVAEVPKEVSKPPTRTRDNGSLR